MPLTYLVALYSLGSKQASTTLCTGTVKNIISNYIHNGSPVLGCLVKLVNHGILFQKLYDRGLSQTVILFLSSWYITQQTSVRWVIHCQIHLWSLMVLGRVVCSRLFCFLCVGCHWGCLFAGAIYLLCR